MVIRWGCGGLFLIGALLAGAPPLAAQFPAAAGIARAPGATSDASRKAWDARVGTVPAARGRVAHGVLVGAGVGAIAGLLVAALSPHSSHADNGLGYVAAAAIGAVAGMVVGAAIGAAGSS